MNTHKSYQAGNDSTIAVALNKDLNVKTVTATDTVKAGTTTKLVAKLQQITKVALKLAICDWFRTTRHGIWPILYSYLAVLLQKINLKSE